MRALIVATLCIVLAAVAGVRGNDCHGHSNPFPVNREPGTLVRTTANGKRYLAGQGNDTFHIAHVYGSHYDMGVAHGRLFAEFFPQIHTAFEAFLASEVESVAKFLPPWLATIIADKGVEFGLNLTMKWTRPFTPQKYIDEMQGMADGSGYSFETIYRLNMFPELIRAACTIVGATRSATSNGKIAHLRDLDFGTNIPVKDWPLVTVMHGDGTAPKVVNFGWVMFMGSLTGISEHPMGIGEKVWWPKNWYDIDGVKGQPWMFILRDVLATSSVDEALSVMQNANRTCAIHVGVGDGIQNEFRGVQMAKSVIEVFNWTSINYPKHPIIEDVMYWDKHEQPSHFDCLPSLLQSMHGSITAETLALNVSGIGMTGDFHSVSFDYEGMTAFYSNARKTNVTEGEPVAYWRQYTFLDLKALFAEQL